MDRVLLHCGLVDVGLLHNIVQNLDHLVDTFRVIGGEFQGPPVSLPLVPTSLGEALPLKIGHHLLELCLEGFFNPLVIHHTRD